MSEAPSPPAAASLALPSDGGKADPAAGAPSDGPGRPGGDAKPAPAAPQGRANRIIRNVFSSWTGYAVQVGITLALTPYVLRELGTVAYGVWVLASSITGYYGLLALGLPDGIRQHLTFAKAKNDYQRINLIASSAWVGMTTIALVLALLILPIAWVTSLSLDVSAELARELFWSLILISFTIVSQFACNVFAAVLFACERWDLSNSIGIASRLAVGGLTFLALYLGYGLIGLAVVTLVCEVADDLVRRYVAYRLIPSLRVSPRLANWRDFRAILSLGLWNFVVSIATTLFQYSDAWIIAVFLPVAAVTPYTLAARLVGYMQAFVRPTVIVCFPAAAAMHAAGDIAGLRRLFLVGTRFLLLMLTLVLTAAAYWAADFYRLWTGPIFVEGVAVSPAPLFHILALGLIGTFLGGMGDQILQSTMRMRVLAKIAFFQSLANIAVNLVLVQFYGLAGLAIGTASCALMFRTMLIPAIVSRQLGMSLLDFARQTWIRPAAIAALMFAPHWAVNQLYEPKRLVELFALIAVAEIPNALLVVYVGLSGDERRAYVMRPLRKVFGRR
jgi:O-antigen/teichoic acid export membrane protein